LNKFTISQRALEA